MFFQHLNLLVTYITKLTNMPVRRKYREDKVSEMLKTISVRSSSEMNSGDSVFLIACIDVILGSVLNEKFT